MELPDEDMSWGEWQKAQRETRGWTQKDLAKRTDLWQSEVSKYETGAVVPEMGAMIAIARAFNEVPPLLSMAMRRYLESPFTETPEQALVTAGSFG